MSGHEQRRVDRRGARSVYEGRYSSTEPTARWVEVATIDPVTGEGHWREDWGRHATGWWPIDEFMRQTRGIFGG